MLPQVYYRVASIFQWYHWYHWDSRALLFLILCSTIFQSVSRQSPFTLHDLEGTCWQWLGLHSTDQPLMRILSQPHPFPGKIASSLQPYYGTKQSQIPQWHYSRRARRLSAQPYCNWHGCREPGTARNPPYQTRFSFSQLPPLTLGPRIQPYMHNRETYNSWSTVRGDGKMLSGQWAVTTTIVRRPYGGAQS